MLSTEFDQRTLPVYHTERPLSCKTLWAWYSVSHESTYGSWDLSFWQSTRNPYQYYISKWVSCNFAFYLTLKIAFDRIGLTHDLDLDLWPWPMTLTYDLDLQSLRAIVITYSLAKVQGRRSVGSEDRVETNGRTAHEGGDCIRPTRTSSANLVGKH